MKLLVLPCYAMSWYSVFAIYDLLGMLLFILMQSLRVLSWVLSLKYFFFTAFCLHFLIYFFKLHCAIYLYENVNELQRNEELQAIFFCKKTVQRCLSNKQTTTESAMTIMQFTIREKEKEKEQRRRQRHRKTQDLKMIPASEWLLW